MLLRSFKAQGFKNFRQPVVLDDLGPINVIHGPNNVGKSNVLQAMELFFWLLGLADPQGIPLGRPGSISDNTFETSGRMRRTDIFNLEAPLPIQLEAIVETTSTDLERAGISPQFPGAETLHVSLSLERVGDRTNYTIQRLVTANGKDFAASALYQDELADDAEKLLALLSRSARVTGKSADRYARIGIDRLQGSNIALELYDAKESPNLEDASRWDRFADAMGQFADILGDGKFVVTYDRRASLANLFFQTARARVPLSLLGSGVQQLAMLLGRLLVEGSTIAGLEEPELNLRYTLQQRLREVLQKKIVGVPGGLDQLFITSHSDAFEAGSHFYLMEPTPKGPTVTKRPLDQARTAIGMLPDGRQPPPNAPLCYISTEGVVRVPERIRSVLGLPKGGGIVFIEHRDGRVEVMSDETFAKRYEPSRDENGNDA